MYIKFHQSGDREVVAICDDDLLGKKFSEGDLNLIVSNEFYGGEKKDENYIKNVLLKADNINLVGKECVELAIKLKIIDKKNIIKIKNIPYAIICNL